MDDFGRVVRRAPRTVVRPESAAELAEAVRGTDLPVAARGCGHSAYGQAQAPGGLVVDLRNLTAVHDVRPGRVVAGAGLTWRELLDVTLPLGAAPPVLTDYLGLSLGGTLSAGGVGGASFRYGAQVDNVAELEVVTGTGETVTCSSDRRRDLYDAVRAGFGRCGIITRATLSLVPAPERVRKFTVPCEDVRSLTASLRRLVADGSANGSVGGRADHVSAQAYPAEGGGWRYEMEVVVYDSGDGDLAPPPGLIPSATEDLGFLEFADQMSEGVAQLETLGEWQRPHPWSCLFLPDSRTDAFVERVMADLTPADIGASGVVLINPHRRDRMRSPLLRLPSEPVMFLFCLLRTASPGALPMDRMVAANRELYERAHALGGTRYPSDAVPFGAEDWAAHYGSALPALRTAKHRYDPAGRLAPVLPV